MARLLLLLAVLLALLAPAAVRAGESGPYTVLGFSQGGVPLVIHHLGSGARRVLILGGQHGGPEANTVELARGLREFFQAQPEELPGGVRLDVLEVANPDGLASGSRQFLSGVDPNRNWGSRDWQPASQDSNGVYRLDIGGPAPFSEPETRMLRDWIVRNRPTLIINYHSAGGFMFGTRSGLGGELATLYAEATGYYWSQPGAPRLLGYRVNGSMGAWQNENGLAGVFVELTSPWDAELERNLAGVRAVLRRLGSERDGSAAP